MIPNYKRSKSSKNKPMKKTIAFLAILFITVTAIAQAPDKLSYQAVIRNYSNVLISNAPVGMKISILQGSAIGAVIYSETHTPISNNNGLISIDIGTGTAVIGTFAGINWATGPYFIKTETDPTGGTAYSITGTNQFLSVPYAKFASTSGDRVALQSQITSLQTTTYPNVLIGTQYWMEKNLDVTNYRNGDIIPYVSDPIIWASLTTGAWCYYNNDPSNEYGKIYNWYAVNDSRGLAPSGWHVPSHTEWTALVTYLGGGGTLSAGKMKTPGTNRWTTPNSNATNSSGFSGLPGGYRNFNGQFGGVGNLGFWWTSSESPPFYAWYYYLTYDNSPIGWVNNSKLYGCSVRCIKD